MNPIKKEQFCLELLNFGELLRTHSLQMTHMDKDKDKVRLCYALVFHLG